MQSRAPLDSEVPGVARDQSEVAAESGRRDQRVNDRKVSARRQFAPTQGYRGVDRQNPVLEMGRDAFDPRAAAAYRLGVGAALQGDSLAQFSQRQNAQEQSVALGRGQEGDHPGIGARLAGFRDDVRIEEMPLSPQFEPQCSGLHLECVRS